MKVVKTVSADSEPSRAPCCSAASTSPSGMGTPVAPSAESIAISIGVASTRIFLPFMSSGVRTTVRVAKPAGP